MNSCPIFMFMPYTCRYFNFTILMYVVPNTMQVPCALCHEDKKTSLLENLLYLINIVYCQNHFYTHKSAFYSPCKRQISSGS